MHVLPEHAGAPKKLHPCPRCGEPYSFVPPSEWHIDPAVCGKCRAQLRSFIEQQHVVFFVGPDMCGKTQIAKELSKRTTIPYFKASSEHDSYLSSKVTKREAFLNQLRYADPRVFDVLKQTGNSIIFDRGFPCEAVYSHVMGRETDSTMLLHMDEMWASIGAKVVLCGRSSYEGIVDDLDPNIRAATLQRLHDAYVEIFANRTRCRVLRLNVDDEDLDREVKEVMGFMEGNDGQVA